MLLLNSYCVLKIRVVVFVLADLESLPDLRTARHRIGFEILSDIYVSYPDNGYYSSKVQQSENVWLGIINATSDVFKQELQFNVCHS